MTNASTAAKAESLHALHVPHQPLLLANAWDVASAVIIRSTGAAAIATTSAGVAWSVGVADGDQLGRDRAIDLITRVCAVADVPVTADIEAGYGRTPAEVGETVRLVLEAGAVGINLEDVQYDDAAAGPLRSIDDQAERIAAARAAADAAGIRLFINARTDTYLRSVGEPDGRLQDTLTRGAAYLAAGADGIFVPGTADPAVIGELVDKLQAPLNILVGPGSPAVAELARLGVARISLGSSLAQAAYGLARRAATELLETGEYTELGGNVEYGEFNDLLSADRTG